jgi:hypothetical protein
MLPGGVFLSIDHEDIGTVVVGFRSVVVRTTQVESCHLPALPGTDQNDATDATTRCGHRGARERELIDRAQD